MNATGERRCSGTRVDGEPVVHLRISWTPRRPFALHPSLGAVERWAGISGGRRYELTIRAGEPDHVAVFAGDRGGCSIGDGCGLRLAAHVHVAGG